jgi:hypothetical protein
MLGENVNTVKKNTESARDSSKGAGQEARRNYTATCRAKL